MSRAPIAAAALLVLMGPVVRAQTPAPVNQAQTGSGTGRVSVDGTAGYGRLLFTFDRPAPVAAALADGVLTLHLSQAIGTAVDSITNGLSVYISAGRRDADGLTYRFILKQPATLHTSTEGNQTAIDLVPRRFNGVPPDLPGPPLPPPPPQQSAKVEVLERIEPVDVKVRVAEFANYTRLVFDWPKQVAYVAFPGQGRVSIRFEAPAKPDFSMLDARRPAWVKSAGWHLDGNVTVVEFETDNESGFRDSREGQSIIVDVLAPKSDASPLAAAGTPLAPKLLPVPVGGVGKPGNTNTPPAATLAVAPLAPMPQAGTASQNAKPRAELRREGAVLQFPEARGHAVAAFNRGGTFWLVLDRHPPMDVATFLAPLAGILSKAEAGQAAGATILKLAFKTPLLASVAENEASLTIALTAAAEVPTAIAFVQQSAGGKAGLSARLPGATHAIALGDAEAGDRLIVVPGFPGKGVLTPRRFVEVEALPTAAGIALVPLADDVAVEVQGETVIITRPAGLALAAPQAQEEEPVVQSQAASQEPGFVDFVQWAKGTNENVLTSERALRAAVARLAVGEANAARVKLARFLLTNELAAEALGEIALIEAADRKLAADLPIATLKGAAQVMMARYADAKATLSAGPLERDVHAAMWRGIAEAKLGDFANAKRDLAASQDVLRLYPESLRTRVQLAQAETGIAQGDLASASAALEQISKSPSPRDALEAQFYQALVFDAQGRTNEAIARLRSLEANNYSPIAARATLARVETELAAKKITPAEVIEALEKLRYRWRGDDLELKTLRKLGSLYFAEENWREGLGVLRVAALNFPGSELGREAQDDMRRAYNELFLGGKAETLRPVDALAMFYDFVELTPIGREGDEMIRRLSDRLVSIDLLGPAAQLLDHQVKERLEGVARASVATKLALIYLLDQKPKEALTTINETRQTRLPDELNEQRRLLEARALSGLKQFDRAIDLVAVDTSLEAKRLRAEIYWDANNWALAGSRTEDVLGQRWNAAEPLDDMERGLILRAGVAYSLAGDEAALALLRQHYEAKMKDSPDAKAFATVTERIDRQGVAFRDFAKTIASVDSLQSFMEEFKKNGTAAKQVAKVE